MINGTKKHRNWHDLPLARSSVCLSKWPQLQSLELQWVSCVKREKEHAVFLFPGNSFTCIVYSYNNSFFLQEIVSTGNILLISKQRMLVLCNKLRVCTQITCVNMFFAGTFHSSFHQFAYLFLRMNKRFQNCIRLTEQLNAFTEFRESCTIANRKDD